MKRLAAFTVLMAWIFAGTVMLSSVASAQSSPKLFDPEIASVAVTANQVDIDNAQIAKEKSKNADVQKFAQTMIADHTSVIDQAVALVKKLNVTPKDNDVSKKLSSDGKNTQASLRSKSDDAFDKAYIDNEVAYHKAVISTVQDVLIPQAQNNQLKQLLQSVMPVLKTHLEHAEMIQKNLK